MVFRGFGRITGSGILARVARGSMITLAGFALSNIIRLGANLILARLLFPEVFGLMALVTVLLLGLALFSDIGISAAVQGHPRGDETDFLNTAWTLQLIRSVLLFAFACAMAWPMAWFYAEPQLIQLIPVAALSLLLHAAQPTRMDSALRHLQLAGYTRIELLSQGVSVVVMVVLAWITESVWALVAGNLATVAARAALAWALLPGIVNKPRLERRALGELLHFGKWVFLSTLATFLVLQSDKLVLGRYLDMEGLGLYNIGFFLAGFPLLLGQALIGRMMIPIYRENPPSASAANFQRLRRIRFALSGLQLMLALPLILAAPSIVGLLYDPRYTGAAVVMVMIGLALLPQLLQLSYDQVALASGDSRGYFLLNGTRAVILLGLLLVLVPRHGAAGAALAIGLAPLLSYPLVVRLARRHGAWDGLHDLIMGLLALGLATAALTLHAPLLGLI